MNDLQRWARSGVKVTDRYPGPGNWPGSTEPPGPAPSRDKDGRLIIDMPLLFPRERNNVTGVTKSPDRDDNNVTQENNVTPKPSRGQPKKYASRAEQQRAYRERKAKK